MNIFPTKTSFLKRHKATIASFLVLVGGVAAIAASNFIGPVSRAGTIEQPSVKVSHICIEDKRALIVYARTKEPDIGGVSVMWEHRRNGSMIPCDE